MLNKTFSSGVVNASIDVDLFRSKSSKSIKQVYQFGKLILVYALCV